MAVVPTAIFGLVRVKVPAATPMLIADAAAPRFSVVTVAFSRLNVVAVVVRSPPLTAKSAATVTLPVAGARVKAGVVNVDPHAAVDGVKVRLLSTIVFWPICHPYLVATESMKAIAFPEPVFPDNRKAGVLPTDPTLVDVVVSATANVPGSVQPAAAAVPTKLPTASPPA